MNNEYIKIYDEIEGILCEHSTNALNIQRKEGRETLEKYGFPTLKDEEYLNSHFAITPKKDNESAIGNEILDRNYGINANRLRFAVNAHDVFKCAIPGIQAHVAFIVNDTVHSLPKTDMNGAVFCSMKQASETHGEIIEKYLGKSTGIELQKNDAYLAMNKMFAQDGYFLYVPKGVKVELPVQIINVMWGNIDSMANNRNLIVLEQDAELHTLVCDHASEDNNFFANRQTEVFLGENAHFHYYYLENSCMKMANTTSLYVDQAANSRMVYSTLGLLNGTTRNNVIVNLNGENADVILGGTLISDKKQHTDNHTVINHNAAHCTSKELYKYIMDEDATAIFSGLVVVGEGAQQTVAQQTNRNILLTDTARIWTKPQLVIYADDVKCSHGATTGQLDEKALFYMQQRGIGKKEARMLLLSAFSADVIALVEIEVLRERLTMMIERRLNGGKGKCDSCALTC